MGRAGRGAVWALMMVLTAAIGQRFGPPATVAAQEISSPIVVTWQTSDGGTFRTIVENLDAIARISDALAGDGIAGVPIGTLLDGDGGVNAPHAWHLENVTIADMTIELCDGTPAMIDADLDTWLTSVGSFCPWSAVVIAAEPLAPVVDPTAPPVEPEPSPVPDISPCADDAGSDEAVVVTFETGDHGDGDTFQAVLTDPQSIARAQNEVALGIDCGFPNGLLIAAEGERNAPHAWELSGATYTDMAIEACSASASEVDANLDYWLGYGRYCPWSAQAIAIDPLAPVVDPTATPAPAPTDLPVLPPADGAAPVQPVPEITPEQSGGALPAPVQGAAPHATAQPVAALPNTGAGGATMSGAGHGWWLIGAVAFAICSLPGSGVRFPVGEPAPGPRRSP